MTVSSTLRRVGAAVLTARGLSSTLEKTAVSEASLSCAETQADVELAGEGEADGGAGGVELAVGTGDEGVEAVTALYEADAMGCVLGEFDLVGVVVGGVAELEGGETVAVEGDIDGGRAGE